MVATTAGGTSASSTADQFTYVPPPTISGVAPAKGPTTGGKMITVTGTNLTGATVVFGTTPATNVQVNGAGTSLTATSPSGTGTVDVVATTPGGSSATSTADQFTYVPPPKITGVSPNSGPLAGGTVVTITGTNLAKATVAFGTSAATNVVINGTGTSLTAISPPGSGRVDVKATTAGGTSAVTSADQFTYLGVPAVSGIAPVSGKAGGNTTVTITGTNLAGATSVNFGANPATSFTVERTGDFDYDFFPGRGRHRGRAGHQSTRDLRSVQHRSVPLYQSDSVHSRGEPVRR